jgi:predicted PurR-regulated permease PerM
MARDYSSDPSLLPAGSERIEIVKIAAWLVVGAVSIAALYVGQGVLIPLAIAFLIGFALSPIVTWLTRCGLPRVLAVIVVMLSLGMLIVALGFLVASQVRTLSAELPVYQSTIREKVQGLGDRLREPGLLDGAIKTVDTVQTEVAEKIAEDNKGPRAQRVEVVEPPVSPFKTAMAWLAPAVEPLATAGIVIIFSFLVLLDRGDLRDRLIRLLGGNIHRATDAMEDAGKRISKYLWMQLVVNVSYAIPMAFGLWLIGVPGWLLWGTLAALMRFVPYVGPILSAAFPLTLAFAVDPGWGMLLWTLGLIVALEIVSNNVVEPLLYGSSTGLSAMSLIAAAIFWTALWGPVGLILSTPLTVCLLVVGRNHPQLQFLDTLLGSTPVLDIPTRVYQRLIANDPEGAIEIVDEAIEDGNVADFYNDYGIEVLRRVSDDYLDAARAEHRLRIANGMDVLLDDLRDEYPASLDVSEPRVVCIGGKWEIDSIACEMLAHALALDGIPATQRREGIVTARHVSSLDLDGIEVICLSYFSRDPTAAIKSFCRRLRQRWPDRKIVLALWNAPEEVLEIENVRALGADEVVASIHEAVRRIHRIVAPEEALQVQMAAVPPNDTERVNALLETRVLDGHAREDLDGLAKRAADVFNVKYALISAIDAENEFIVGQSTELPGSLPRNRADMITMEREAAICTHVVAEGERLVVNDTQRDPRFAEHPAMELWGARFYAGAPLKTAHGFVLGALCLLDTEPRKFEDTELELLDSLAADVVSVITGDEVVEPDRDEQDTSATVGQKVPQ